MAADGRITRVVSATLAFGLIAQRLTRGGKHGRRREQLPTPPAAPSPPPGASVEQHDAGSGAASLSGLRPKYKLVSESVSHFLEDDCTTLSAALAYYTTFSIAPLLLIVISIVGLVFGREAVRHQIQNQVEGLIGKGAGSQIGAMVQNAGQNPSAGVVGTVLGIVVLLVAATGAFSQLQSSLNRIWHVQPDPRTGGVKNFIGKRVLSLGMILGVAFLLLVSLIVSAALSSFDTFIEELLPRSFSGAVLTGLEFILSLAVITVLFAAMYKVLPDVEIRWRDVWFGAAITAVLFTIGKFLIGLYLGHSGTVSSYGAAGSLVLIVLWVYYSSLIVLFGAELTARWSEMRSGQVRPKPGAIKVEEVKMAPSKGV